MSVLSHFCVFRITSISEFLCFLVRTYNDDDSNGSNDSDRRGGGLKGYPYNFPLRKIEFPTGSLPDNRSHYSQKQGKERYICPE